MGLFSLPVSKKIEDLLESAIINIELFRELENIADKEKSNDYLLSLAIHQIELAFSEQENIEEEDDNGTTRS